MSKTLTRGLAGGLVLVFSMLGCAHKAPPAVDEGPPLASEKLAKASPVFIESRGSEKPCQGDTDCMTGEICYPETERCMLNYPNPRMLDIAFTGKEECKAVNLYFPFDSAEVIDEAKRWLDYDVRCIKSLGAKEVIIEGHADSRGPKGYNEKLSVERATSVARMLNAAGLDLPVKTKGFGEREPMRNGKTEKDYAFNRRVVFTVR